MDDSAATGSRAQSRLSSPPPLTSRVPSFFARLIQVGISYENFFQTFAMTCNSTTLKMKPKLNTSTTTGSTISPLFSSVYSLIIVPELPPAPAALVLAGRAFLTLSL